MKNPLIMVCSALLAGGLIWLLAAWQLDTTVWSGGELIGGTWVPGSSVHNIGLQDDKRNQILVSSLLVLIGSIGVVTGLTRAPNRPVNWPTLSERPASSPPCPRDLTLLPYKTWLIERYKIKKSDVLGTYICGDKEFLSSDDALASAHERELEAESVRQIRVQEQDVEHQRWIEQVAQKKQLRAERRQRDRKERVPNRRSRPGRFGPRTAGALVCAVVLIVLGGYLMLAPHPTVPVQPSARAPSARLQDASATPPRVLPAPLPGLPGVPSSPLGLHIAAASEPSILDAPRPQVNVAPATVAPAPDAHVSLSNPIPTPDAPVKKCSGIYTYIGHKGKGDGLSVEVGRGTIRVLYLDNMSYNGPQITMPNGSVGFLAEEDGSLWSLSCARDRAVLRKADKGSIQLTRTSADVFITVKKIYGEDYAD